MANPKGGVGKTSIVANVAGIAAKSGWRVLAVDLDPQGDLSADLGYGAQNYDADGNQFTEAVLWGGDVTPMASVRPNLDVLSGGSRLDELVDGTEHGLANTLRAAAVGYDLVLIDCPPGVGTLLDGALLASRWIVVPVRLDPGSLDGLQVLARRVGGIRNEHNPDIGLLGVALFGVVSGVESVVDEVTELLETDLQGVAPVLAPPIRHDERSAFEMRRLGMLAHESPVTGLATDYLRLSAEILSMVSAPLSMVSAPLSMVSAPMAEGLSA
ncbi:MAG: ParA family protein [Acidimicrobiales bacterium]